MKHSILVPALALAVGCGGTAPRVRPSPETERARTQAAVQSKIERGCFRLFDQWAEEDRQKKLRQEQEEAEQKHPGYAPSLCDAVSKSKRIPLSGVYCRPGSFVEQLNWAAEPYEIGCSGRKYVEIPDKPHPPIKLTCYYEWGASRQEKISLDSDNAHKPPLSEKEVHQLGLIRFDTNHRIKHISLAKGPVDPENLSSILTPRRLRFSDYDGWLYYRNPREGPDGHADLMETLNGDIYAPGLNHPPLPPGGDDEFRTAIAAVRRDLTMRGLIDEEKPSQH